jgi:hypothetical protein
LIKFGIGELKNIREMLLFIYLGQINVAAILDEDRRVILRSSEVELAKYTHLSAAKCLPRTF